jgi:hypothetical protein
MQEMSQSQASVERALPGHRVRPPAKQGAEGLRLQTCLRRFGQPEEPPTLAAVPRREAAQGGFHFSLGD